MKKYFNNERFEFIDGLRGLAALYVVLFHLNLAIQSHVPQFFPVYLEIFFSSGYLGIEIFFVLSGFVIAYSMRQEKLDLSFFIRFFVRRSLRLDPPYWTVVAMTFVIAWMASLTFKSSSEFPFSLMQVTYNLLYLPNLLQVPLILPVAWTLCIEFQFYLVFVLFILLFDLIPWKKAIPFLWASLSFFSIIQNTPFAIIPPQPITFIPHWYSFFLGCATCWALLGKMDKKFLWMNYFIVFIASVWTPTPHALVSVGIALTIFIVSISGKIHELFSGKFFQYMGRISYSLYLLHWPVGMKLIEFGFSRGLQSPFMIIVLWAVSLGLSIGVADLFYRIIERPTHLFSRQFYLRIQRQT